MAAYRPGKLDLADAIVGPLGFSSLDECVEFLLPRGAVLADNNSTLLTAESVIQKPDRAQTNAAAAAAAATATSTPAAAGAAAGGGGAGRFDVEKNVAITHGDFGLVV